MRGRVVVATLIALVGAAPSRTQESRWEPVLAQAEASASSPVSLGPLTTTASWSAEGNQTGGRFGTSTKTAGDVNGDGYDDVIVGAFTYDNGQSDEGRAFLYLGSPSGPSITPDWTAEPDKAGAHMGIEAGSAGDVNGDGYGDVIVGADLFSDDQTAEGRAFVYLGSASGLSATPAWIADGNQAFSGFGFSAATAGDVNGDGYDDVIVGAHLYTNDLTNEGRAYLYLGSPSGPSATPAWITEGNQGVSDYGNNVSSAGDVNGDGYDDVIVCAGFHTNGQFREGRAFLYMGSPAGLPATPDWTAESDQTNALFCSGVGTTAGDVNGDGYDDVLIGAHFYDNGQTDEGRAYVYLGSAAGLSASPAWIAESNQAGSDFGRWAATAGDVDADGYDDVVVGAFLYDNAQTDEGRILVYLGSAAGLSATAAWTAESDQTGGHLGISCSAAGDVNGDGAGDVIAGAHDYDNGQTDEGKAFLYLGVRAGCKDADGDGYGSPGHLECANGDETDCDDGNPAIHPGATEVCNTVDDDCDATVDDGYDVGATCSVGVGACAATGTKVCDATGAGTVCSAVPGTPVPESCDGLDNDCDGAVDDNAIKVQAVASISPTTLNVNAQGSSFTLSVSLVNACDPAHPQPLDGHLLERAWISRAGNSVLPDPSSFPCPAPNGDILFERGIVDDILARGVNNNAVSLKYTLPSDGDCRTLDGDRQDLIALLTDILDDAGAPVCVSSAVAGVPFETCASVVIRNRGNR